MNVRSKAEQLDGIIAEMNRRFAAIKQARVIVIAPPAIPGLGNTGGFSFILEQRESTDDIKGFEKVVQELYD